MGGGDCYPGCAARLLFRWVEFGSYGIHGDIFTAGNEPFAVLLCKDKCRDVGGLVEVSAIGSIESVESPAYDRHGYVGPDESDRHVIELHVSILEILFMHDLVDFLDFSFSTPDHAHDIDPFGI